MDARANAGWITRHWLLLANVVTGLMVAGAVLAPALDALGFDSAGAAIRAAYQLVCAQRPSHSSFPFGHQLALEDRMIAMAVAQLVGGLAYAVWRDQVTALGWLPFVFLSIPMAWDGFSQMFGLRDSDWLTRTWTGALFSVASVAVAYPRVDRILRPPSRWRRDGAGLADHRPDLAE